MTARSQDTKQQLATAEAKLKQITAQGGISHVKQQVAELVREQVRSTWHLCTSLVISWCIHTMLFIEYVI
jgi:hypothetical protein